MRTFLAVLLLAVSASAADRPLYYERELTPQDLEGRSLRELNLMRNWIYARAGNVFRKRWLHAYFAAQDWYRPSALDPKKLSETDRKNADAIAKYELSLDKATLAQAKEALAKAHALSHPGAVTGISFSPDSQRIATVIDRNRLITWDIATGAEVARKDIPEPPMRPGVAFANALARVMFRDGEVETDDHARVYLGDDDVPVLERDGKVVRRFPEAKSAQSLAISGDGTLLVAALATRNLRVIDATTGTVLPKPKAAVDARYLYVSRDGARALSRLSTGENFMPTLWQPRTGVIGPALDPAPIVRSAVFSKDGKRLWVGTVSGQILAYDTVTGQSVAELRPSHDLAETESPQVDALALNADGTRLAAGFGDEPGFAIYDTATGAPVPLPGHAEWSQDERIENVLLSRALGIAVKPEEMALVGDRSPLDDPALLDAQITVEQLKDLSRRDLRILRNMVYARRGRVFASPSLNEYFGRMAWYSPDPAYSDKRLTKLDQKNIKVISSVEAEVGGPMKESEAAPDVFTGA